MSTTSYNGWPASPDPHLIGVNPNFAVAGVAFPGGVKAGDVALVLGHVAGRIHTSVEALVPGWCWGYEWRRNRNDPSTLSTHASATSVDINAPRHANGAYDTFTATQVVRIREILREVQGVVWWGRDWEGTPDEMHFEIHGTATKVHAAALQLGVPDPPVAVRHPFPLPKGSYFGPLSGPAQSISGMASDGSDTKWRPTIARIQTVVHVAADGRYGPVTINSVKGWQAAHRMVADGLTGPKTWAAMGL